MSRPTLVMGNWKMNLSREDAVGLARQLAAGCPEIPQGEVVLLPSPLHVDAVGQVIAASSLVLGAQDCVEQGPGACTGGTSVAQLAEIGARWILVGHSERRAVFGEDDALLSRKFAALVEGGLNPVLCVGETLEEREAGRTAGRIAAQIEAALPPDPRPGFAIAYEPVWAIGTGRNAVLADVVEVHELIRERLSARGGQDLGEATPVLYGGSVNETNAGEYLGHPQVDGALVGGASLDGARFREICSAGANGAI
jgi:triosephosphate isomerase